MSAKNTPLHTHSFEKTLTELTALIEKMESGQLSLEESLSAFETGISLIRHCQKTLSTAEHKIQLLTQKDGETIATDFVIADS